MDARVSFIQPGPETAPHERRHGLHAAAGRMGGLDGVGKPAIASKYAVKGGMDATSYDVDFDGQGVVPQRSKTVPPVDFGHPRGLAEDPVRPGCYSNFGKGGVRHYRRRGGATRTSGDTQPQSLDGALGPTTGPVRYGHRTTTGLGSMLSLEGVSRKRGPYLHQRSENFVGLRFVGTDEPTSASGGAKHAPGHKHASSETPWANHFNDANYTRTNHNDVFGAGGERRHVLAAGEQGACSKHPMDTSHLFCESESPERGES